MVSSEALQDEGQMTLGRPANYGEVVTSGGEDGGVPLSSQELAVFTGLGRLVFTGGEDGGW